MESSNEISFDVVKAITQIAKMLEDSKLDDKEIEKIESPLSDLCKHLDVATNQAIIFSIIFVLLVKDDSINLRDIVRFLDINYIDSLNFKKDFDILLKKNLLEIEKEFRRKPKNSNLYNTSYCIPNDVLDSLYCNLKYLRKPIEKIDIYEFVKIVADYISQRGNDQINTFELFEMVEQLESSNDHIKSIMKIQNLLEIDDRTLLYEVLNDHIIGYPSTVEKTLREICQNPRKRMIKVREIVEKTNKMYDLEFITLGESKFANDFTLNLTVDAIEFFMEEDATLFMRSKNNKNILLCENIVLKELFFEPDLAKDIDFLTESLNIVNFKKLQDRLEENKLSKGVAAIFYGTPGTGKTETAFRISKLTGRNIMIVDISQTKSMWFGESEKIIKEIFDNYRKVCNTSEIKPILLFNECDAILNKRLENSHSNVGQTENAIQNILLEEMEKFEGILIATTNLQKSLDAAYERRFLFKIKFDIPAVEVKSKIWKNKLSWINDDFVQKLASEFSFSGGEIDNIVRKVTMIEVLTGNKPETSEIYNFCQNEKKLSGNIIKIGYL